MRETTEEEGVSERQMHPDLTRAGWRKTLLRYRLDIPKKLGWFHLGATHCKCVPQQSSSNFKTREEDHSVRPFLMLAFFPSEIAYFRSGEKINVLRCRK